MRIYLIGFMGAGKSFIGELISREWGLPWIDLDRYIEEQEGASIPDIFEREGESYFRTSETRHLRAVSEKENLLLSCGGGTPCHSNNMAFMNESGLTVWLDVPLSVIVDRIMINQDSRPLLKGKNRQELSDYVSGKLEERKPYYSRAQLIVNPAEMTINTLIKKIEECKHKRSL